jgi:uncharacterized protein (TIGR00290 family)
MYAVATSGGKDSTLALHEAHRRGLPVSHLFHVYGVEYGRTRFHGYRPSVLAAQADALGLQPLIHPTRGDCFEQDFAEALRRAAAGGVRGLLFGNLHLRDVSDYYRRLVEGAGLEHREMLWGMKPDAVLSAFVEAGFRAVVTSVWLRHLGREWLGRRVDRDFLRHIRALEGVDPCGENGEYHTLVFDGPPFRRRLEFTTHGVHEEADHVYLDVRAAPPGEFPPA